MATALVAMALGGYLWLARAVAEADRQAVRNAFVEGRITRDDAREILGDEADKLVRTEP